MNRGNLAEDPRAGLSSSSRYSRDGGERNSLLYVDSSSLRKERKAAARRAGKQARAIKGDHNSRELRSVGRGLTNSHMDRLEVGSDGRLFHVKESPSPAQAQVQESAASANLNPAIAPVVSEKKIPSGKTAEEMRPAIHKDVFAASPSAEVASEGSVNFEEQESSERTTGSARRAKPDRSYLNQSNPLLRRTKKTASERKGKVQQEPAPEREISAVESKRHHAAEKAAEQSVEQAANQPVAQVAEQAVVQTAEQPAVQTADQAVVQTAEQAVVQITDQAAVQTAGQAVIQPVAQAAVQPEESHAEKAPLTVKGVLYRIRIPLIAAAIVAASAGYGYTAWHYRNRFYPGTEFFGIPAAEQSVYDVKAAVKAKVDSYSLQLEARKPETDASAARESSFASDNVIDAEDVAMVYRDNGEIDNAMKQQKTWAWPVMMIRQLLGRSDSALQTSFDDSKIPDAVASLACMQKENIIKPQDAEIILTDDGAQVQPEIYGTLLDKEKTEEAVRQALIDGSTSIDLDDLGLYINPEAKSSDVSLITEAMAMNKVLGAKVLLRFGNRTEVINSEVIASFLDKKGSSYSLNEEKVRDYVTSLAEKYDTFQREREFYTSIGTKITLEEGIGDYGWQLDQEATYEKLLEAIRTQKKATIEPVYTQEAYCRDANDIGDTYVEISLTNQKMWFYKNGNLVVETPVVTGNPYAGHETPSGGVWSLKGRARNQTLSGQGYASPVDYWMPFNNGVGIHDMQSRYWFGGTIYLGSGSHGCVNTPLAAVKLIYDQIEEGVPIVVYKDESDEALSLVTDPVDAQTLKSQIEETYGTVEDDGIGSIVAWSRTAAGQAQVAAVQAQAQALAAGTPAT